MESLDHSEVQLSVLDNVTTEQQKLIKINRK